MTDGTLDTIHLVFDIIMAMVVMVYIISEVIDFFVARKRKNNGN